MAGESKTGAVTRALKERRDRLRLGGQGRKRPHRDMQKWLETEIWPQIPAELKGRPSMTKDEVEEILGIGPEGY